MAIQEVKELLGKKLRVEVEDGRVFFGQFYCLDNLGNLLLQDTYELDSSTSENNKGEAYKDIEDMMKDLCLKERFVGIVLIPQRVRKATKVVKQE